MIIASAGLAAADLFSPPFRAALWKSLGLTIAVLIALWFGLGGLFRSLVLPLGAGWLPDLPAWAEWAGSLAGWGAGLVLAVLLAFLIGPISAVIAGAFLDDVAEVVEAKSYPSAAPGRALPLLASLRLSLKFFGIVVLGNLLALALLLVPGINLAAFFLVNGYLLGREYFEFAALRYRPEEDARDLRRRHRGTVFLAGLAIAGVLAIPFLNLLTPLFAAAMMVHLHQRISARDPLSATVTKAPGPEAPALARSAPERHSS